MIAVVLWFIGAWVVVAGCVLAFLAAYGFFALLFSLFRRDTWRKFRAFLIADARGY